MPQDQITPVWFPSDGRVAWITMDAAFPVVVAPVFLGMTVTQYYGDNDQIEVASMPGVFWAITLIEEVSPDGEPAYRRYSVRPPFIFVPD